MRYFVETTIEFILPRESLSEHTEDTEEAAVSIVVDTPSALGAYDLPGQVEVMISARRFERIVRGLRKSGVPHRIDTPGLIEFEPGMFRLAGNGETPTEVYTVLRGISSKT